MFFSTKNSKGADTYTFACTVSADCKDESGIPNYDEAFTHQKKHDAKKHPDRKRTN